MAKIKYIIAVLFLIGNLANAQTPCPSGLSCTTLNAACVVVNWSPSVNNFTIGYTIAYSTVSGFNPTTVYRWVSGKATVTYTLTNLLPNTTYYIAVKAEGLTNSYDSQFSAFGSSTTMGNGVTPVSAPSAIVATALSTSSISLNWTCPSPITNIVGYTVATNTVALFNGASYTWNNVGSTSSCTINGLNANTTYYFAVKGEGTNDTYDTPFSSFVSCTTLPSSTSGGGGGGGGTTSAVHQYNKIVVVIGENTNASAVFGSPDAPYINGLAATGAKFTNSFAVTHPSQPNYLALFSGSTQGITGDGLPGYQFTTPNLARELQDAGKSFIIYSEDLPSVGFNGASSGGYQRKHNPLANWMGTGANQVPSTLNQPWYTFPSNFNNLPNVSFVIPNQCNDGHDVCGPFNNRTKQYDFWLQSYIEEYRIWCKANNSLLIVTYDEDDFTPTNKISTVFYGAYVMTGTYSQTINHYNVLRTIEDACGLTTHAGQASTVSTIDYCWQATPFIAPGPVGTISAEVTILSTEYIGTDFMKYTVPYSELPRNKMLIEVKHMSDGTVVRNKFIIQN